MRLYATFGDIQFFTTSLMSKLAIFSIQKLLASQSNKPKTIEQYTVAKSTNKLLFFSIIFQAKVNSSN
jgi:hypothetical protein